MLSVPPGTDAVADERVGYLTGLRTANVRTYRCLVSFEIQRAARY